MAMANWKMAKAQQAHGAKSADISFYYKEAFKHFQVRMSANWKFNVPDSPNGFASEEQTYTHVVSLFI